MLPIYSDIQSLTTIIWAPKGSGQDKTKSHVYEWGYQVTKYTWPQSLIFQIRVLLGGRDCVLRHGVTIFLHRLSQSWVILRLWEVGTQIVCLGDSYTRGDVRERICVKIVSWIFQYLQSNVSVSCQASLYITLNLDTKPLNMYLFLFSLQL